MSEKLLYIPETFWFSKQNNYIDKNINNFFELLIFNGINIELNECSQTIYFNKLNTIINCYCFLKFNSFLKQPKPYLSYYPIKIEFCPFKDLVIFTK